MQRALAKSPRTPTVVVATPCRKYFYLPLVPKVDAAGTGVVTTAVVGATVVGITASEPTCPALLLEEVGYSSTTLPGGLMMGTYVGGPNTVWAKLALVR